MNHDELSNLINQYDHVDKAAAIKAGREYLQQNQDAEAWTLFLEGINDVGASNYLADVADACFEGPTYAHDLHCAMAKSLRWNNERHRADQWIHKFNTSTIAAIMEQYKSDDLESAALAVKQLFDDGQMCGGLLTAFLRTIHEAQARDLLVRIGQECLARQKYDTGTYEFMADALEDAGRLHLAIQWIEAHIGEDYLDFLRESCILLRLLFDNGDVNKAESVMKGLNKNLTDEEFIDRIENAEGGVARLYALYAKLGAQSRPTESTRALFEQAIDYTQFGDGCLIAMHEAKEMFVEWLDSIGDVERAHKVRSSMASTAERQRQARRLVDRWLFSQLEPSDANTPADPQAVWQQLRNMRANDSLINRFLFLVERFGNEDDLLAICHDLRHKTIEDQRCASELAAWLIAVLFPSALGALDYLGELTSISNPDYAERWARCLEYLLAKDYQGAAEAAAHLLASYDMATELQRPLQCRQLVAYCELTQGRHAEAAKSYQHLIQNAEASGTDLDIEVYSDAAKAFSATHMSEAAAKATAKVNAISKNSREPP